MAVPGLQLPDLNTERTDRSTKRQGSSTWAPGMPASPAWTPRTSIKRQGPAMQLISRLDSELPNASPRNLQFYLEQQPSVGPQPSVEQQASIEQQYQQPSMEPQPSMDQQPDFSIHSHQSMTFKPHRNTSLPQGFWEDGSESHDWLPKHKASWFKAQHSMRLTRSQSTQFLADSLASSTSSCAEGYRQLRSVLGEKYSQAAIYLMVAKEGVRESPSILLLPLALLLLLAGAGVWGALQLSDKYKAVRYAYATDVAQGAALRLSADFQLLLGPITALQSAAMQTPHVPDLLKLFPSLAKNIAQMGLPAPAVQIQYLPFGRVEALYPELDPGGTAGSTALHFNALAPSTASLQAVQRSMGAPQVQVVVEAVPGPGGGGGAGLGLRALAYLPVFIPGVEEGELFGLSSGPYPCTACPLYNSSTRTKWWGVAAEVILMDVFLGLAPSSSSRGVSAALTDLVASGWDYSLELPVQAAQGAARQLAASTNNGDFCTSPVAASVQLPGGAAWVLYLAPGGCRPWGAAWSVPLLAAAVALALLAAGLLAALLLAAWQFRKLVWNMLPPKVVKALSSGQEYAENFPQVTILFSDIVAYTNMSSEMTPSHLVGLLKQVFGHYDELCVANKMFKVETIGDAFMCVAGCPTTCSPTEAALRAANMAMDMLEFTHKFVNPEDGRRIQIRIGMYTGNVTAAVMGTRMYHMCLVGDTVNVASRMESNSKPMQCHIGAPTARLLSKYSEFVVTPRGVIDVKGKGSMETFWLRRSAGAAAVDNAVHPATAPSALLPGKQEPEQEQNQSSSLSQSQSQSQRESQGQGPGESDMHIHVQAKARAQITPSP